MSRRDWALVTSQPVAGEACVAAAAVVDADIVAGPLWGGGGLYVQQPSTWAGPRSCSRCASSRGLAFVSCCQSGAPTLSKMAAPSGGRKAIRRAGMRAESSYSSLGSLDCPTAGWCRSEAATGSSPRCRNPRSLVG